MPIRLLAIAGEASGDTHGGALLAELQRLIPDLEVSGIGGPGMEAAGLRPLRAFFSLQVHGLVELIRHIPRLYRILWDVQNWLTRNPPDAVLLIDYPGFNLKVARHAKKLGIPVIFYSSPQIWAWRGGRLKAIAQVVDLMLVLFPFEAEIYRNAGVEACFLGHPLVGVQASDEALQALRQALEAPGVPEDSTAPLVALMPGSRPSELERILPTMLEAVRLIREGGFAGQFMIPLAPSVDARRAKAMVAESNQPVRLVSGGFLPALRLAKLAIVASGTATLQVALAGIPFLVVYRASPFSFWLLRRLAYVPYISIVNILAGRALAPELLQEDFTPERLCEAFLKLSGDEAAQQTVRQALSTVADQLGKPGAYERAAALIAKRLQG